MANKIEKIIDAIGAISANAWEHHIPIDGYDQIRKARPTILVGVYLTPSGVREFYVTARDNAAIFLFTNQTQIYAVVASKCSRAQTQSGTPYYLIVQSDDDFSLGKSPLRPIACKLKDISVDQDLIDEVLQFVVSKVARTAGI
jgi:hypothetical protein